MGVRRLFIMGLATDFVVRDTMLDALGANEGMPESYEHNERPTSLVGGQVVLVDAASRGIIPANTARAKVWVELRPVLPLDGLFLVVCSC